MAMSWTETIELLGLDVLAVMLMALVLLNVVEQSVALSTSPVVPASLVQQALRDDNTLMVSLDEARRAFEHDYLVRLLRSTDGNVTQAARMAQRNRTEFYKLLQRHNLTPAHFKSEKA